MDDFVLEFGIGSLLGHRTKIKDLPKLTSLLKTMLRNVFIKQLVYPSRKNWRIPKGSEMLQ
jgi:maintenance of morphology protein 1